MEDTPIEVYRLQQSIFHKLSVQERWERFFEMIEMGRSSVAASIKKQNPGISETDFKIEMIKRFYKHDFSEIELNEIIETIRNQDKS